MSETPSLKNQYLRPHLQLLRASFKSLTGQNLVSSPQSDEAAAQEVFEASYVVLSHGTERDPVFNYVNQAGMDLFEMNWTEFTRTPSRLSAEPVDRDERQRLMDRVTVDGYIDDYSGIRISSTGKRFEIHQATVWNLTDKRGHYQGQAAVFSDWTML
jgi:hypothetical protein